MKDLNLLKTAIITPYIDPSIVASVSEWNFGNTTYAELFLNDNKVVKERVFKAYDWNIKKAQDTKVKELLYHSRKFLERRGIKFLNEEEEKIRVSKVYTAKELATMGTNLSKLETEIKEIEEINRTKVRLFAQRGNMWFLVNITGMKMYKANQIKAQAKIDTNIIKQAKVVFARAKMHYKKIKVVDKQKKEELIKESEEIRKQLNKLKNSLKRSTRDNTLKRLKQDIFILEYQLKEIERKLKTKKIVRKRYFTIEASKDYLTSLKLSYYKTNKVKNYVDDSVFDEVINYLKINMTKWYKSVIMSSGMKGGVSWKKKQSTWQKEYNLSHNQGDINMKGDPDAPPMVFTGRFVENLKAKVYINEEF